MYVMNVMMQMETLETIAIVKQDLKYLLYYQIHVYLSYVLKKEKALSVNVKQVTTHKILLIPL